ncbi:MAG: sialidase family protein [Capsulimonadaceae bacterium]|nr:sialidase family protein [Capsulimonadaceae bacterium]
MFETTETFRTEGSGYVQHRIPVVCVTAAGSVLVFAEARRTRSDWGDIDILMRRSVDGGRTFGDAQSVAYWPGEIPRDPFMQRHDHTGQAGRTHSNSVAIADTNGAVHLIFCIEYRRAFYRRSDDDGLTWSDPADITSAFEVLRDHYPWRVIATGPSHGVQLRSGRLLTPFWASRGSDGPGGDHHPSIVSSLYSDDDGATWRSGDIVANETDPAKDPNETSAVELPDGRVLFNMRNESERRRRLTATSPDGATRWAAPVFDEALVEPICHAGLVRAGNDLYFSNPSPQELSPPLPVSRWMPRKNLVVRMSCDFGCSWPIAKAIDPGDAGYSDMNALPDGTLLCAYEIGGARHILARFDRDWLTPGA